ncbi:D-alanyl-D-alanine carboxypeptidase family protein [Acuticoccus mangrovi]|uniref:D-alanyl-D-alanine carboxypeptidase n=1 Tax=Acuticoccus mangrovi TaxID=2796142 RepID=A0A934MIX6_9HYPH|nr:D-alanyl-D-alanine carboxypeptidase family protein [Acuticoccus mangrovi]MBJ3778345.1 D-alanyl-D-alanine carboxypeptidase [Acuticoccus mangrovi]
MRRLAIVFVVALLAACSSAPKEEASRPSTAALPAEPLADVDPDVVPRAYAGIVVDARTGQILYQEAARSLRYPASLTKMMTLYLLFEQLDAGRLTPASPLSVSEEAASRPPAKLGVKAGTAITVDTAARALAVRSANDVAVVIAENLAGSEENFARAMTAKARSLGMARTNFVNASGLPDPLQYTTAQDMAILGKALSESFPRWFGYFQTEKISYNGRTWRNTNKLLGKVPGVEGIKTGYIRDSGFNLVTSVRRGGKHIIAVVIGGRTGASRNKKMEELIETYMPKASGGGIGSLFGMEAAAHVSLLR